MAEKEYLDKEGLEYYHNSIKSGLVPEYQVKFEPTENQTLSATLQFDTSFSGSSDFTVNPFSNPIVTPSVVPDGGYRAGTPSVSRSGNIFTVSVTDAIEYESIEFDVAFVISGYATDNNNNPMPIQFKQAGIMNPPVFYLSGTKSDSGIDDADIVISPDLSWIVSGAPSDSGTYVQVDREELVKKDQFVFKKGQISDNNLVSLKLGESGKLYIEVTMPVISSIQLKSRSNTSNVELTPYLDVFLKTPSGDISIDSLSLGYPFTVSTNDSNSKKYIIDQNLFNRTIDLGEETVQKMKEGRSTLYFQVVCRED